VDAGRSSAWERRRSVHRSPELFSNVGESQPPVAPWRAASRLGFHCLSMMRIGSGSRGCLPIEDCFRNLPSCDVGRTKGSVERVIAVLAIVLAGGVVE